MKYILLHGLGQKPSAWESTVKVMNHSPDILYPDLSEWLYCAQPCYSNLYQAFDKYCGQFDEPLTLCGLSLGGILALHYAIEHREKVHSLALIGTQARMPKNTLKLQNMVFRIMPHSVFRKMGFCKKEAIDLSKSMMDLDFRQDLKKIGCRVLVLCGEKDKANRPASLALKQALPNAEFSMISHAGHEVNLDNPLELGEKLNAFFSRG